jgi:histidinol dehydrogenase
MLQRIDLRSGLGTLQGVLPRAAVNIGDAAESVRPLIEDVRRRGADAVLDAAERFDGIRPAALRVPAAVIEAALRAVTPGVRAALTESIARARSGHAAQLPTDRVTQIAPGGTVTQRWMPVRRVGLYVPGGLALYPSSVVMNVVPAQVAGVRAIAVTSPPQRDNDGWPDPNVLAACALLGVDEVYAAGGAQGIALLALGAVDVDGAVIEPVDVITDDSADPVHVAADLISQAEHDPLAASVLITTSVPLADAVDAVLAQRVSQTKHRDRVRQALTGRQSGVVLVGSLDEAIMVADAYAAEHLEIQTRDAATVAARISTAGAVFVGPFSPVSLGDYCAGSNHVLPTGGSARFSAGLSAMTFLRQMQVIDYSREALAEVAPHVLALSAAEDLPAHGEAVTARFDREVSARDVSALGEPG